ncbi:MAG: transglycosylase SLT domain-containing protein [Rikenellaceae bacterium]
MFNKTVIALALFNLLTLTNRGQSTSLTTNDLLTTENRELFPVEIASTEISPYDSIFRSISEQEGTDWRLLCAMAYHESRFLPDVVSRCGARGIMQVMPHVARQFDVSAEQLNNVEDNIYVANRVMVLIDQMLRLPATTPEEDRLKMSLAAYNCGIGRVLDARRLARSCGENAESWEVVAQCLRRMNNPEYYQMDVVKYGRFTGAGETLAYVSNVVDHYEDYCLLAMR